MALVASVALTSVALTGCGLTSVPSTLPPGPSATRGPAAPSSQVQGFLQQLFTAARSGDQSTWGVGVSRLDPAFAARAEAVRFTLHGLELDRLEVRLTGAEETLEPGRAALLGPGARVLQAAVSWRLMGETALAEHNVWVTVVPSPAGPRLAGIDDGSSSRQDPQPLWWGHRVTRVDQDELTLLLGAGQSTAGWLGLVADSVADARTHLPGPLARARFSHIVVEVPESPDAFAAVLGVASSTAARTGAVTRPEGPTTGAALRVVVNPALAHQPEFERRLTLTHETVHVATGSARSPAPLWAVEGLAESVAYRSQPSARRAAQQRLARELQRHRAPTSWPTAAAFGADAAQAGTAYAQSWIACDVIARQYGSGALGDFLVRLDAGDSVTAAARRALHADEGALLAAWRAELNRLAAGARRG